MKSFIRVSLCSVLLAAGAAYGAESPRVQSVKALDMAVKKAAPAAPLAQISDLPPNRTLGVGKSLEVKLTLPKASYVSLVYVDSHGVLEVFQPTLGTAGNFGGPGEFYFPGSGDEAWQVRPPVGPASIYIVSTAQLLAPFTSRDEASRRHFLVSSGEGPAFAAGLARELARFNAGEASLQKLDMSVELTSAEYSANDIVRYFTETTRSVKNPRLDVYVNFDFNSADIAASSLKALDTWGRVLKDPLMRQQVFVIGGHTDDVGTEEYNETLSVRRAEAVRDYLVGHHGIRNDRLQVRGYGKAQPLVEGTDDTSRQQNRRVDFERSDRAR